MIVELPTELEQALQAQANAEGVSVPGYVRQVLEEKLAHTKTEAGAHKPFKTSFGILSKYGPAPSAQEIDENRAEMFRNFGEDF